MSVTAELGLELEGLAMWDTDLNLDDDVACGWVMCEAAGTRGGTWDCPADGLFTRPYCEAHAVQMAAWILAGNVVLHMKPGGGCDAELTFIRWRRL